MQRRSESKMPWPGFPSSVQLCTVALRELMMVSGTGHSPIEFRSSLESRSG